MAGRARHQSDRRLYLLAAAYPAMKQAGGGKIINIGSMFSIFGAAYAVPYSASKGGLVQMTKSLAAAWAPTTSRSMRCCLAGSTPNLTRDARAAGHRLARAGLGAHPSRPLG